MICKVLKIFLCLSLSNLLKYVLKCVKIILAHVRDRNSVEVINVVL